MPISAGPSASNPPSTLVRQQLKSIVSSEFAAENVKIYDDRLHASLGSEGNVCGLYPRREIEWSRDVNVLEIEVVVQMFSRYNLEVDPHQTVNPAKIEDWADRFRTATNALSQINDPNCWFFRVVEVTYPPDPTGNITRFEAVIRAYGNNSGQV